MVGLINRNGSPRNLKPQVRLPLLYILMPLVLFCACIAIVNRIIAFVLCVLSAGEVRQLLTLIFIYFYVFLLSNGIYDRFNFHLCLLAKEIAIHVLGRYPHFDVDGYF